MMAVRQHPQIKDVLIFDNQEYVIQAIDTKENSIVVTLLGIPGSGTFVLKGAQLRWLDMLQAWKPVNVHDFYEIRAPISE